MYLWSIVYLTLKKSPAMSFSYEALITVKVDSFAGLLTFVSLCRSGLHLRAD